MPHVLLASSSPRRQHLLRMLGVEHRIEPSQFDEYAVKEHDFSTRESYVQAVAAGKILEVALRCCSPDDDVVVLGGDLVTHVGNTTFHKPKNYEQAREFLHSFLGVWHEEIAAVGVWYQGELFMETAIAEVFTPQFSDEQIQNYLNTASPLDKSGGYSIAAAIRTLGKHSQEKVELRGEITTVLGMPVSLTAQLLRQVGVTVNVDEHALEQSIHHETFLPQL